MSFVVLSALSELQINRDLWKGDQSSGGAIGFRVLVWNLVQCILFFSLLPMWFMILVSIFSY